MSKYLYNTRGHFQNTFHIKHLCRNINIFFFRPNSSKLLMKTPDPQYRCRSESRALEPLLLIFIKFLIDLLLIFLVIAVASNTIDGFLFSKLEVLHWLTQDIGNPLLLNLSDISIYFQIIIFLITHQLERLTLMH